MDFSNFVCIYISDQLTDIGFQTACRWINIYAEDQDKFFADFRDAYTKLVNSGASWKTT